MFEAVEICGVDVACLANNHILDSGNRDLSIQLIYVKEME